MNTTAEKQLTGTWKARCPRCRAQYSQYTGPTPCCGLPPEVVDHKPDAAPPAKPERKKADKK